MSHLLSESEIDRRNILNNPYALEAIQEQVGFVGIKFNSEYKFTVKQVSDFYEVSPRTIERYLVNYAEELKGNGYEVLTGKHLEEFKKIDGTDTNVGTISRASVLGLLNFRAFLNIGMLLTESEKARLLRAMILNIVLDVVGKKAGGSAKYVNQRDDSYLISLYVGENYRKDFTEALKDCVDMGNFKYAVYTNKIYKSIFKEHAGEYRALLSLTKKENVRDTMYSEVLTTISMYETGLASELRNQSEHLKRKLTPFEVDKIFSDFEKNPAFKPQIELARRRMASLDYGLRDIMHPELTAYVNFLNTAEFERFLGEKSAELAIRVEEYKEIFKRLKDK
jgi:hypothetical protein